MEASISFRDNVVRPTLGPVIEQLSRLTETVIGKPAPANELDAFDHEVESLEAMPEEICAEGIIRHHTATLSDGERYPVLSGTPKQIESDTAVVFTTAWLTSTRGHNRHTMYRMMKLGYPVIMIGPEGELRNSDLTKEERYDNARRSSLMKVSYDMNRILDEQLKLEDVRPDAIITLGESRGAMTGFGFDVPQYSGERRVAYADLTAPCFPRQAKWIESPQILAQLVPEALSIGALGWKLRGNRLRHYPATLHKDPEYYGKEVMKIFGLMSGQAGTLAVNVRPETPMHIRIFEKDGWSQADEWEAIFDRPSVRTVRTDGYHLAIAEPSTLRHIEGRLTVLKESRGCDGDFSKVNFQDVLHAEPITHKTSRKSPRLPKAA